MKGKEDVEGREREDEGERRGRKGKEKMKEKEESSRRGNERRGYLCMIVVYCVEAGNGPVSDEDHVVLLRQVHKTASHPQVVQAGRTHKLQLRQAPADC